MMTAQAVCPALSLSVVTITMALAAHPTLSSPPGDNMMAQIAHPALSPPPSNDNDGLGSMPHPISFMWQQQQQLMPCPVPCLMHVRVIDKELLGLKVLKSSHNRTSLICGLLQVS